MPFARKTTTRRAKAQYKKSGPTIAQDELKRLERAAELDRRAAALKEREKRRKIVEKTRMERTEREKAAREQLGIGLATQLVGYSHSQKAMKGGMEGWLGMGRTPGPQGESAKRKREDDTVEEEKENRSAEGEAAQTSRSTTEKDSFGSNMSLDDAFLGQLDGNADEGREERPRQNTVEPTKPKSPISQKPTTNTAAAQRRRAEPDTPPQKRAKLGNSPDEWAEFVDDSTQVLKDSSPLPQIKPDPRIALPPMSTQDLELDSDDFLETGLPKTTNPEIKPEDGVIARDFAYFEKNDHGSFFLKPPGAPALSRKSRTERSIRRSFGRRFQRQDSQTIPTPSPKMTAGCANYTPAQCSFTTADYHQYGFSTQILQQAIDDGDDDTESEDEEVYSQALATVEVPDSVLMPPPPITLSPKVFKPPGLPPRTNTNLFAGKGGLQIFGLSTQLLNDAIDEDDVSTDEDEDDTLFQLPLNRGSTTDAAFITDAPATATTTATTTSTTNKQPSTNTNMSTLRDFGLSTQVLQDAALDEIELTDDEDTQDHEMQA